MLGTKLYKGKYTNKEYADLACWCNANGCTIEEHEEYYEVVAIPAPSLEGAKQAKLQEVDQWTASKITGGFLSGGVRYDSDIEAQATLQGIALIVNTERFTTDYPHGYPESGYDEGATEKTIHYLTAEEVLMLCSDLSNHINKCRRDGWTMKQEVLEATTKEELDNIQLD